MNVRTRRILRITGVSLAALVLVALVASLIVVQTDPFRRLVRDKIIEAVESSTGGRVELGEFQFEVGGVRATLRDFVLHGTEPAGEEPLFRAERIAVDVSLTSALRGAIGIDALEVDKPRLNLIVFPDGRTNVPRPDVPEKPSDKSPLETVVDLAIGRFEVVEGLARFREQSVPFSARGENLRVGLAYDRPSGRYRGSVDLKPLFLRLRQNERLDVAVHLPVIIGKDSIELDDATLTTPHSQLRITGSLEDLANPRARVNAEGRVDLAEVVATTGESVGALDGPRTLDVKLDAGLTQGRLRLSTLRLGLGRSQIEASGEFKNTLEDGVVDVSANLVVSELVRLTKARAEASGTIEMKGRANVRTTSDFAVNGRLTGRGLSFRQGNVRVVNAQLASTFTAGPQSLRVDSMRLDVAGGRIEAQASVDNWKRYEVSANLRRFQLNEVMAATGTPKLAWAGQISGPASVAGELGGAAVRVARTDLSIVPAGRGIPMRGRLAAVYDGINESLNIGQSHIELPSSRINFSGTGERLSLRLTSVDLNDFLPALALASSKPQAQMPVALGQKGHASVEVVVMGKLSAPSVEGRVELDRFQVQDRSFDKLGADLRAGSNGASIEQGTLIRGPLQTRFHVSVGLRQWKPVPASKLAARLTVERGDLQDVLALAGRRDIPVRGDLHVVAQASGTVGDPQGSVQIRVQKGEAYGEPIDNLEGRLTFGGERVELSSLRLDSRQASLNLNALFEHPRNNFTSGRIRARVRGNEIGLASIMSVLKRPTGLDGHLQLDFETEATLHPPKTPSRFELVAANGKLGVRDIRHSGDKLGDLSADIRTTGNEILYQLDSNFAGSVIHVNGNSRLAPDYPTVARVNIQNLPVERAIVVSGKTGVDAKGLVSVRGEVAGTLRDPAGELALELSRGIIRGQSVERAEARLQYSGKSIGLPVLEVRSGDNRLSMKGLFTHPVGDFSQGDLKLAVETNSIELAQIVPLRQAWPGLSGSLQLRVEAAGEFDRRRSTHPVIFSALSAKAEARKLAMNGGALGGLSFSAVQNGSIVNVQFDSDLVESSIRGSGQVRMEPNYPVAAQVSLGGVRYSNWARLANGSDGSSQPFDALIEGKVDVAGPALEPRRMTGAVELTKAEAYTAARERLDAPGKRVTLRNDGPVVIAATPAGIEIKRARWTGPSTSVAVGGTIRLEPESALDLEVAANVDLELLEQLDSEVHSEGAIELKTAITGPLAEPVLNGKVELRKAAFQRAGLSNGLSNANGVIELTGASARIASFTGETGGGEISLSGDVSRSQGLYHFNLQSRARRVRIRTEAGASVVADADIQLAGNHKNSLASGNVNIQRVSYNSRTDFGSTLTRVAPPQETPSGKQGPLNTMRLNIKVRMGSNTTFLTTFSENLEAVADLTVRGTAARPGMLGRVVVSQGELVFFGTKYSVNEGTVSFFNPDKIEPVLNLNLGTTARGVQVVLVVTGSVQNMNLAYHSDPPLQFSEIIGLLAVGRLPTSDPVLLANQPATPQQSLPQMGASALLETAVANPIAGQLERVFGVSKLKIDPTFTSGSELPQARLTIQQQITSDLTFTYVTNVTRSDPQIVRAEWVINPNWSAIATRQENGMVGVDLFYKKNFQ